jgi:hypothetical protein
MALLTVDNRSTEVQKAALDFEIDTMQHPDHRQIGMSFARLAQEMILRVRHDDAKLIKGLAELKKVRDHFITTMAGK